MTPSEKDMQDFIARMHPDGNDDPIVSFMEQCEEDYRKQEIRDTVDDRLKSLALKAIPYTIIGLGIGVTTWITIYKNYKKKKKENEDDRSEDSVPEDDEEQSADA